LNSFLKALLKWYKPI